MIHKPHLKPITVSQQKTALLKRAHLGAHLTYLTGVVTHYGATMIGVAAGTMAVVLVTCHILHVEV